MGNVSYSVLLPAPLKPAMAEKHSSFLTPYHDDQLCGDTNGGSGDEAGSGGLYRQAAEPG